MTPNLGARSGDVGTGDIVICRGEYAEVTRVRTVPIGASERQNIPVAENFTALVVETTRGIRYLGAEVAYIGSDLRLHWER